MRTLGIDLAAADDRTGAVVMRWSESTGVVELARQPTTDEDILSLRDGCDAIGIDAPFG